MSSELLQQVRVLDPVSDHDRVADVLIEDGVIRAIADTLSDYPSETIVQDGRGLILGPGLVDLYSHSGEPGSEERETLRSLARAAAAGGFTRIAILPDTIPAVDNPGSVAWMQKRWWAVSGDRSQASEATPTPYPPYPTPQLYCWGALTLGAEGQQMTELGELAATDIVGFADGRSLTNWLLIRRVLEYLKPLQKPVALFSSDSNLTGNGVMREGPSSLQFGLPGIPAIAETVPLLALLECVETIGTPVHLMRISTARGVALVRAAKARGVPITASTTWMHLLLNSRAIGRYDPNLHICPPLGNPADQEALQQAVQEGIIDAIAIDHTPYTYEEKTVSFAEAPPGAIGLELALPLLWQSLVETGQWTALALWRSLSTRPALCLQQKVAAIAPGKPAELTLFDPKLAWTVNGPSLQSIARNTPWLEQTVTGRVVKTWTGDNG